MRSWTTFIVFGVILVALLVVYALTQYSTATDPMIKTSQDFLTAVQDKQATQVQTYLDLSTTKVVTAGSTVISISFNEASPFKAAFQRQPAVTWDYLELAELKVNTSIPPHIENNMATVRLSNDCMIFYHRVKNNWKIFYITKPKRNA